MTAWVELGKHVLDKDVLDVQGLRCGKVDDVVLALPDDGSEPEVVSLVTGPLSFARLLGPPVVHLVRLLHRLLGVEHPEPVEVRWDRITRIDVAVHIDLDRHDTTLNALGDAIAARLPSWMERT